MKVVKIKDHEELVRDVETRAVLNTDLTSLQRYKARRKKLWEKDHELQEMKTEISELKVLLHQLIEKVK